MRDVLTRAAPALPKAVARLCNQIANERARPYTVATAHAIRTQAQQHLDAGLPPADLVRLLKREYLATARTAAAVHADTPDLVRLVLAPARFPRAST